MSVGARGYYPITDRRYGCVMPGLQLQWPCRETVEPSSMDLTAPWTIDIDNWCAAACRYWMNIGTEAPGGAVVTSLFNLLIKPVADSAVLGSRPTTNNTDIMF